METPGKYKINQDQEKLGFGESPQPKRIFIGKESGSLWYFFTGKIEPIPASSLTGYLRSIEKRDFVSDFGISEKLLINIEADRNYQIVSGYSSWFSRSFLLSASRLDDLAINRSIAIEPYSNSNTKVIFANLYDWSNTKIYPDFQWVDKDGNRQEPDWTQLFIDLSDRLGGAKKDLFDEIVDDSQKKDGIPF